MTTGEKIKMLREQKNLTQEQLGAIIGVQNAAIYKYENGLVVNLKRTTIDKLAKALDCTPAYLMGWTEESETESKITDEDIKFALFGGDGEITDDMYEEVKRFAAFIKEKHKK